MTLPALDPHASAQGRMFRQVALDQLSSPEQLDTLMKVTDTQGWLALLGCAALLGSALAWGVFGSIPSKQPASGILIHRAGLGDVAALGAGQLTSIDVSTGDEVRKGQTVARLAQPGLRAELAGLHARRQELQVGLAAARRLTTRDQRLRSAANAQARGGLRAAIESAKLRERELGERVQSQLRLRAKSLVTKDTLLATQDALRSARDSIRQLRTDLQQIEVDGLTASRMNESERQAQEARIQDNERRIQLLEQRLEQDSRVTSAYDGRVVELRATSGDVLEAGQVILSLERTGEDDGLEALLYVDSRQSKRIEPGMRVDLSPSMARRERYGVLRAHVRAIEDFPSTRRGMLHALHNEQLVDSLLDELQGVPTAVRATLELDPGAAGGYLWSSSRGGSLRLSSGTRCSAAVLTGTRRPIALLFPTLEAEL
jgi:HlyD family secretion protein